MDIFRFHNPTAPTKMESGEIINGLSSKMWVERYATAGEFTFVGQADKGIKEKLPIGSFISHLKTSEIMIVENHEINGSKDSQSEITVTGRGFETFFENRVVGSNVTLPRSAVISDYILPIEQTWNQAVELINRHIVAGYLIDPNNAIPYVYVLSMATGTETPIQRTTAIADLYSVLMGLLAIDNLGIQVIRPIPVLGSTTDTMIIIHRGVDRSSSIMFSYDSGEIVSADYLWSNKNLKNAVLITGKWVQAVAVSFGENEYNRRMMYISASDLDDSYSSPPTGATYTAIEVAMVQRGLEVLSSQNDIAITKAEVSKQAVKAKYRTDYDLGDMVTVTGDYNETSVMRVMEYVEIEDATGESGYPTLSVD